MNQLTIDDIVGTLSIPKIGSGTLRSVINSLSGEDLNKDVFYTHLLKKSTHVTSEIIETSQNVAKKTLEKCNELDITPLPFFSKHYPRELKRIPDYPLVVYYRGSIKTLNKRQKIAVVGTRNPSEYGTKRAQEISKELSSRDICVVSGLALGIDAFSHNAALYDTGSTIAVLASGLDQITPKSNQLLAQEILANNGVLISEYPPGTLPHKHQYIQRNRLQSGLSKASIVVESSTTGGSMYQGQFTQSQKRRLFVISPEASNATIQDDKRISFDESGAKKLIEKFNATPIHCNEDLIKCLPDLSNDVERDPEQMKLFS